MALIGALLCSVFTLAHGAIGKTAMQEYVEAMQPGWNLGNTLDAPDETAWGNPLVTEVFIQEIAAQGFKSIRIPVSWGDHMGTAPDYTVDPVWMARVEQIVNWSLDAGLYVMLNVHHDSYWIRERPAGYLERFSKLWEQIAPRFRDHSQKLMLETINEPDFLEVTEAERIALVNELNTTAYDIIRATGGGNATRPIVMPTVVTNAGQQFLDALKAEMVGLNDPNLIATVHFYGYWPFSVNVAGGTHVDANVLADINNTLNGAYDTFVADGIPVVVGEMGVLAWDSNIEAIERGELLKFFEIFTATARSKGITWQLWDNGRHFNRNTLQWRDPELISYLLASVTGRSSTGGTDLVFVKSGAPADVLIPLNLNGNSFVSLTNGGTTLTPGVDYTITANLLTLKSSLLAPYASGGYGEKTVLEANFSAGVPWKLRVRHLGMPTLSAASGTRADGLVIPAAFNGDLVATMEARYVGGGNAGPHNWTPFKEYNAAYRPNYTNNTVTIPKGFFDASTGSPIDLTFHYWSGRTQTYRLTTQTDGGGGGEVQEFVIYDDALSSGWHDSNSWTTHNLAETTTVQSGLNAISVSATGYGAVVLTNGGEVGDTSAYKTLVFWIHGGTAGGQSFGVGMARGDDDSSPWVSIPTPEADTWRKVEIPLSSLGVEGSSNITRVSFQNWTASSAATLYLDYIHLTTATASDIVFVDGTPAPTISSAALATGVSGSAFSYTVTAVNDPVSFGATGLPAGLTINTSTGLISGTPTTPGTYVITVTATNEIGTTSEEITIRIDPVQVNITFPSAADPLNPRFEFAYDGASHAVTTATDPAGIPVTVTYNGGSTPPTLPGTYRVIATSADANYGGQAEATLVITSNNPGRLINLSMRAVAGTDSDTLIMGFVTSGGSGDIPVLVRGIGPELFTLGVKEGLLADPSLTLFDGSEPVVTNSDWDASLESIFLQVGAFELPLGSKDAAIAADLPQGAYTAHVTGAAGSTGIALGEVYDLSETYSPTAPVLVNASARCQVGSGAEVLIPGFVIGGDTPLRVLIRAIGPGLASEVDGMLIDPRITLFRGSAAIDSNDDWETSLAATFATAGAFALADGSKDAALVVELEPGAYTAHVQSADGSPGVALVEIYALPGL